MQAAGRALRGSDGEDACAPATPVREGRGGVVVSVHVQPGARADVAAGSFDGRLRVKVAAPADDGRANDAVTALLARLLGVRRSDVTLVSGRTSRRKDVIVQGLTLQAAQAIVARLVGDDA